MCEGGRNRVEVEKKGEKDCDNRRDRCVRKQERKKVKPINKTVIKMLRYLLQLPNKYKDVCVSAPLLLIS